MRRLLLLLLIPLALCAQTKSVLKNINGGTITESLTIGSGKTLTIASGASIVAASGSTITGFGSGSGSGSVTSVALALPSIFSVSGSPVTESGTLTGTLATQTANTVFAGPTTGSAAAPTFRALVAADIPDLTATYQPLNAKLTAVGALSSSDGVLTNNGSGTFGYTAVSTGGNGAADSGKLAAYGASGTLTASPSITVTAAFGSNVTNLASNGFTFSDGTYTLTLGRWSLTGNRQIDLPNVSGDIITTGNLTAITATGTITSGTWNGTIVAPAYLGTGSDITTKYLRGDGTWQTLTGTGTVTSVAVSGSDGIEIDSGSPITTSGTIALGVNASTLKTHLSLGNVENTAISTWTGSSNLTTVGTISTGVWSGTALVGTKVDAATTSARGTVELATDGETGGSVAVVGNDSRLAAAVTETYAISCSDLSTQVTTGTSKGYFRLRHALTITAVRVYVLTAPTGSTLIVDINEAGTTILSTKLSVDASEFDSSTAATAAVVSDSSLASGALITVDFDQVGATLGGTGVIVEITGTYTP